MSGTLADTTPSTGRVVEVDDPADGYPVPHLTTRQLGRPERDSRAGVVAGTSGASVLTWHLKNV